MKSFHPLLISMALSLLVGLTVPGFAQENTCLGTSQESTRPNLLLLLDNSGSLNNPIQEEDGTPTGEIRIGVLKKALSRILDNASDINIGLGRFAKLIERSAPPANVPILFPASFIDSTLNQIPGEGGSIVKVTTSIAQASDDAEQSLNTGEMFLTNPTLQMVKLTSDEEPDGLKVEVPINSTNNDAVEWLGGSQKNRLRVSDEILYLGTAPRTNAMINSGDSLIGLRFEKLGIPQGAKIEFAEVEFVSDQEYENDLQINIYGVANDGVQPIDQIVGDPSGTPFGDRKFRNDAGRTNGYLSGEGYTTENFPKQSLVHWDLGESAPKVLVGEVFTTPDIARIIQDNVNREGWTAGNDIVILLQRTPSSSSTTRGFYAYNGFNIPPKLRVYWTMVDVKTMRISGIKPIGSFVTTDHATETKNTTRLKYSDREIRLGKQRSLKIIGGNETLTAIRFQGLNIPQGATISEANITFTHQSGSEQDEWGNAILNLVIFGEKSANAEPLRNSRTNPEWKISARPKTDAFVKWDNVENTEVGQQFTSPSITEILQEMVDNPEWEAGNHAVFLLERNGEPNESNNGFRRIVGVRDLGYDDATVDPKELAPLDPAEPDGEYTYHNLPRLEVTFSIGLPSTVTPQPENTQQIIGLRFEKVDIPNGAKITSAKLEFTSGSDASDFTSLMIRAENADSADSFTEKRNDISDRPTTSNFINWNPESWKNGVTYETDDFSAVIQEVVDREGWCGGLGGLAIIISGSSSDPLRIAKSYDNRPVDAPVLKVEFDSKEVKGNACIYQNFTGQIQTDSDDAEQKMSGTENGVVYLSSDTLELASRGIEKRLVGFRFREIPVAQSANIVGAHLIVTSKSSTRKDAAVFNIYGEKSPNSITFNNSTRNLSVRPKTSTSVSWSPEPWIIGQTYRSPDISEVIQEIIQQEDWETYNHLAIFVDGIGQRDASSFRSNPLGSAVLHLQVEGLLGEGGQGDFMTVRRHLKKTIKNMRIPSSTTPLVDALYEAAQYYLGGAVDYGKNRHDEPQYLVSHPGTYTGGTIERSKDCNLKDNPFDESCASEKIKGVAKYTSPSSGSIFQEQHIMLFTDGVANENTSVDKIKQLIGKTDCITSYLDPDNPETGEIITVSEAEMCGIDLVDFLAERNIFLHAVGFQLGKGWILFHELLDGRIIYRKDGIYYFDEALTIPVPPGQELPRVVRTGYQEDPLITMQNRQAVKFLKRLASVYGPSGNRSFYRADTVDEILQTFEVITAGYGLHLNVTTIGDGIVEGCGIHCGEDCSEFYATNGDDYLVTLTATPKKGSIFIGWSGDCSGMTNPIMVNIDGSVACTATFIKTFRSNLPVTCQLYAVQDDGLNDSQFFTINPETFAVTALGESLLGYDIEALDVHPNTGELYAASGDDTNNPGHLYTVNTQTGAINDLGYTGFDEIEGLSFHTDTLWAWAKGDGLISINSQNGVNGVTGTLVFPSQMKVEDLTWNNEGTRLYAVQDTTLWVSDGQNINQACDLPGHTEAIEMLPNNFLLLGIHGRRNILDFKIMDLATCNLLPGVGIPTTYNDIEGMAWPTKACGGN